MQNFRRILSQQYQQVRTKTIRTNEPKTTIQVSPVLKELGTEDLQALLKEPLTFRVNRQQSGLLPIYRQYKNGKTRKVTVVRKIEGDIHRFVDLVSEVIPKDRIRLKADTSIQINGDYVTEIRSLLTGLKM